MYQTCTSSVGEEKKKVTCISEKPMGSTVGVNVQVLGSLYRTFVIGYRQRGLIATKFILRYGPLKGCKFFP